jgi:hypothetical protein
MRVHWVCLSGIIDTCSYNKKSFLSFSLRGYCRSCTPSITFSESYLYNIISNRLTELIQWRCFYPVEEYFAGKKITHSIVIVITGMLKWWLLVLSILRFVSTTLQNPVITCIWSKKKSCCYLTNSSVFLSLSLNLSLHVLKGTFTLHNLSYV